MRKKRASIAPISDEQLSRPEAKRDYNRALFAVVAPRYDAATRGLSFRADERWKRSLLELLPDPANCSAALDLACGTGDIALLLAERYPAAAVTAVDLTEEMLVIARRRGSASGRRTLRFLCADMNDLPMPAESVDVVTGGYALRNAPDLQQALFEVFRVLRPGGTAAFLDFAAPDGRVARSVRIALLTIWGRIWGRLLHGNPHVYAYIARSLRHFPSSSDLIALLGRIGFEEANTRRLFGGFLAITWMKKPREAA